MNDAADDGAPNRRAMLPIHRPEIPPLSDRFPSLDAANDLRLTAADAESLRAEADVLRASAADAYGADPLWRTLTLARAVALEDVAAKVTTPPPGTPPGERGAGGEARLRENGDDPWPRREVARATRAAPALLDAEASQERLNLAREAGALTLALDAAEGMGAASPAEQMIAHQMGVADEAKREQAVSIEAARLATAAARMMEATARAALFLDRLRNGNRQTVVVQHVAVAEGGRRWWPARWRRGAGGNERGSPCAPAAHVTAIRPATSRLRLGAVPGRGADRPARGRRWRTGGAGCTAERPPGRARRRGWSGAGGRR